MSNARMIEVPPNTNVVCKPVRRVADGYRIERYEMCLSQPRQPSESRVIGALVFGTDRGLLGRFNDAVAQHAIKTLQELPGKLHLFYNRPVSAAVCAPVRERLLPLDTHWHRQRLEHPWPTKNLPEVLGGGTSTRRALIREYLSCF